MRLRRLFSFLLIMLILVSFFRIILPTSFVGGADETTASPSQSGLIKVALTKNVAPRSDWSNGTLYHLRILQKFIPINITVITNFATLSDYQVLFLNMLNISDADITTIANWVNDGGFLVCIGQSGRYNQIGEERNSHPLATVLGVTLDGWERTSGEEVRKVITNDTWHWWSSGIVYDTANNGDGNYPELEDYYYIPKSESVNVTLNEATLKMSCRDKNVTYEEPFLTNNTYGLGRAFFITADAFYRLVWKPPHANVGLYDLNSNSMTAGTWFRSGLLWQILYAIMLDCFSDIPLPIITSMPNGFHTAMSFAIILAGGDADNDTADDYVFGYLMQNWRPVLDSQPELKGWFWGFWINTEIIDGTSNASNIVDFVNEFGYAGSRSHTGLRTWEDYAISSECLRKNGFKYKYEGSSGGPIGIGAVTTLVKDWNFTDVFYHRRISGRTEHGAYISNIPYPISDSGGLVNFFVSSYAVSQTFEWKWLIEHQKLLGQNYGTGGYCMGRALFVSGLGYIPYINQTINAFIDDDTVWKTSGQLFVDWWDKRWQVNMTDFSSNSTQMTIDLQTPNIPNLTLLIREMANPYSNITVDGTPLTPLPESNRIVIPQLSEGAHRIVIKFAKIFSAPELKEYNDQLKAEGKPYVVDSTHVIEYLNYAHQRLSVTLDIPTNATAELKVYSVYPPRQAFANGQPISFTYGANIATMVIPYAHADIYYAQPEIAEFSSSKLVYEIYDSVELTLRIYGDYSTSEIIKWLARVTVLNETEQIVNVTNREIEIGRAATSILIFSMGNLSLGIYTITAEMLDPEALGNVLAMDSLTIRVAIAKFSTSELKEYNDQLKAEGKPYVVDSTHVIEYLDYAHQRLSLTLDIPTNATAELKVYSTYSPRQAFANNQPPQSLAYASNTATILVRRAHVDIYYAQPKISRFSSSKLEYRADESVGLTLEIYGDHSTSEPLNWLARVIVVDETEEIVNVTDREIEISTAEAIARDFIIEKLSEGIYTITAEMSDPETPGNVLAIYTLTISVTETPTAPSIFSTVKLKEYNDELKFNDLPYVEGSTQIIVDLAFSNTYQRLSITLGAHSGVNTELKVYSPYPPLQAFAEGQPISFTYGANIATMVIPYAHADIYYAQPQITEFSSSKPNYEPDEDVELVLKVHGSYSTSEIIKWFIRSTIKDETGIIVKTVYEEIKLKATESFTLQLVAGNFSEGTYTITAEMIDPEAENVLETRSLTIKVAEAPTVLPLIPVILTTTIIAIIGVAVYAWYRLKKPNIARASVHALLKS